MPRYLLVANQTLGGSELDDEVRHRIAEGAAEFHVVVPMTPPEDESDVWVPADPAYGIPARRESSAEAADEARRRSRHRLGRMLDHLHELGAEADGEVGPSDPYAAAVEAMERLQPDRVILSTLPAGVSRWLKLDLQSRLERAAEVPVTTIEARTPAAV